MAFGEFMVSGRVSSEMPAPSKARFLGDNFNGILASLGFMSFREFRVHGVCQV